MARSRYSRAAAVLASAGIVLVVACTSEPSRSTEAFCKKMESARPLDERLAELDPTQVRPEYDALRAAQKVAPPEIEPQVATITAFAGVLVDALDGARGGGTATIEEALRTHQDELADVAAAGKAIESYTRDNCGLELTGTSAATGPTSG